MCVSVHDSRLLRQSQFDEQMDGKEILQKPQFILAECIGIKPIVLGDSAYKLNSWLLPPYPRYLNMPKVHKEVVEGAFGLKRILANSRRDRSKELKIFTLLA